MGYYDSPSEQAFRRAGPLYHLYTKPLESDSLYKDQLDRITVMNLLAISLSNSGCVLLAFSMMSNHFHFILEGEIESILSFFGNLMSRLTKYYRYHGKSIDLAKMEPGYTSIDNLRQFRNELAYVVRNSFVVQPSVNVFADQWSSGYLYFNPLLSRDGVPGNTLTVREKRRLTQSRLKMEIGPSLFVKEGMIQPWSFVDYRAVESFYDSARQYVYSVMKNTEAQIETSLRYGEIPQLADEELFPAMYKLCREVLRADSPGILDYRGKQELAKLLKNKYYASNGQIARVVKMPLDDVNVLFPLVTKNQIK